MANRYTGNSDGDSGRAKPGLLEFVKTIEEITDDAIWNNGTYVNRDKRGKPGSLSVHSTGRAVDLSYRKLGKKGRRNGRTIAEWLCDVLVENSEVLGVECVLDYYPKPFGRGFRWDRKDWLVYDKATLHGAPFGDWLHVELSPRMADSQALVRESWGRVAESELFLRMPKGPAKKNRQ